MTYYLPAVMDQLIECGVDLELLEENENILDDYINMPGLEGTLFDNVMDFIVFVLFDGDDECEEFIKIEDKMNRMEW
jgi:hypothetical protein